MSHSEARFRWRNEQKKNIRKSIYFILCAWKAPGWRFSSKMLKLCLIGEFQYFGTPYFDEMSWSSKNRNLRPSTLHPLHWTMDHSIIPPEIRFKLNFGTHPSEFFIYGCDLHDSMQGRKCWKVKNLVWSPWSNAGESVERSKISFFLDLGLWKLRIYSSRATFGTLNAEYRYVN